MEHGIEHATGIFIGLMLLACTAAMLTKPLSPDAVRGIIRDIFQES